MKQDKKEDQQVNDEDNYETKSTSLSHTLQVKLQPGNLNPLLNT